jgi:hypothetical protein
MSRAQELSIAVSPIASVKLERHSRVSRRVLLSSYLCCRKAISGVGVWKGHVGLCHFEILACLCQSKCYGLSD